MYLAGAPIFLGIYLLYGQWRGADIVAALILPMVFHLLVVRLEEPALRRRLGSAYDEYCRRVPRWIPRSAAEVWAAQRGVAPGKRPGQTDRARR